LKISNAKLTESQDNYMTSSSEYVTASEDEDASAAAAAARAKTGWCEIEFIDQQHH